MFLKKRPEYSVSSIMEVENACALAFVVLRKIKKNLGKCQLIMNSTVWVSVFYSKFKLRRNFELFLYGPLCRYQPITNNTPLFNDTSYSVAVIMS